MHSEYTSRVTVAVPTDKLPLGNALALVLGESLADANTFQHAAYQDAENNEYALISAVVKPVFLNNAGLPLNAPSFAPDADLDLATQAQTLLEIGTLDAPVTAAPGRITAIQGPNSDDAQAHRTALGLTPLPYHDVIETE